MKLIIMIGYLISWYCLLKLYTIDRATFASPTYGMVLNMLFLLRRVCYSLCTDTHPAESVISPLQLPWAKVCGLE